MLPAKGFLGPLPLSLCLAGAVWPKTVATLPISNHGRARLAGWLATGRFFRAGKLQGVNPARGMGEQRTAGEACLTGPVGSSAVCTPSPLSRSPLGWGHPFGHSSSVRGQSQSPLPSCADTRAHIRSMRISQLRNTDYIRTATARTPHARPPKSSTFNARNVLALAAVRATLEPGSCQLASSPADGTPTFGQAAPSRSLRERAN